MWSKPRPTLLKANEEKKIKSEVYLTKIGINDLLAKYL